MKIVWCLVVTFGTKSNKEAPWPNGECAGHQIKRSGVLARVIVFLGRTFDFHSALLKVDV